MMSMRTAKATRRPHAWVSRLCMVFAASALASAAQAAGPAPAPARYGFNWLGDAASCRALTERELGRAPRCEDSTGAFGLQLPSQACRVGRNVEWMVYRSLSDCREALETMQAHAP